MNITTNDVFPEPPEDGRRHAIPTKPADLPDLVIADLLRRSPWPHHYEALRNRAPATKVSDVIVCGGRDDEPWRMERACRALVTATSRCFPLLVDDWKGSLIVVWPPNTAVPRDAFAGAWMLEGEDGESVAHYVIGADGLDEITRNEVGLRCGKHRRPGYPTPPSTE